MHTYINAIYKYGHLYDRETGKRILLKDNAELALVVESRQKDLYTVDPKNDPDDEGNKPRPIETLTELIDAEGFHHVQKLKDRGEHLYFVIKAGDKNEQGRRSYECCFRVTLLEELYMVWKHAGETDGEFYFRDNRGCSCVVDKLVYGELDEKYFEPIYGSSLNDVYTLTYEMYFARFGRSSANIYKILTEEPRGKSQPFMSLRRRNIELGQQTIL